jgi:hypothetical protein
MQTVEVPFHHSPAQRANMLSRGDDEPVGVGITHSEDCLRVEQLDGQPNELAERRHGFAVLIRRIWPGRRPLVPAGADKEI